MKIDLFSNPPPLTFGEGERSFKLYIRPFDDTDRTRVIDASGRGVTALQHVIDELVMAWEGVSDQAGNPIPFQRMGENGQPVSNFPRFLARVDLSMQLEVIAGVMGLLGIPSDDIVALARTIPGGHQVDPKGTVTPEGSMPASATGGS